MSRTPDKPNPLNANPYRTGFADAIFGRPSASPWIKEWRLIFKHQQYLNGYLAGKQTGVVLNIGSQPVAI